MQSFVALSCLLVASALPARTLALVVEGDYIRVPLGSSTCNAFAYGAAGDGHTDDTKALQAAINACGKSGGTALLPSNGTFMSWGLTIPKTSGFALQVDGTLRFFTDTSKWPSSSSACIYFEEGSSQIALIGHGLVDGQGAAWWPCAKAGCFRPGLVTVQSAQELLIANLSFVNSPNHNLELYATPFEVVGVSITAPDSVAALPSHNTDGIDVHGNFAYIHDSHISVGDDHVAMHANDTLVSNCVFGTGHGLSIGSLGDGTYMQNITVRDSTMTGGAQAIRIKADTQSSGFLKDVVYTGLTLKDCNLTILITSTYSAIEELEAPAGGSSTLQIANVTFSDITASGAQVAGQIDCSPSAPCEQLVFDNIQHTAPLPGQGWSCSNAHGVVTNVSPGLTCIQK